MKKMVALETVANCCSTCPYRKSNAEVGGRGRRGFGAEGKEHLVPRPPRIQLSRIELIKTRTTGNVPEEEVTNRPPNQIATPIKKKGTAW